MRLFPIFCVLLLPACMRGEGSAVIPAPPAIPADLLEPCRGHLGPVPETEGQFSDALIAEARGRACANRKLEAISTIVLPPKPSDTGESHAPFP